MGTGETCLTMCNLCLTHVMCARNSVFNTMYIAGWKYATGTKKVHKKYNFLEVLNFECRSEWLNILEMRIFVLIEEGYLINIIFKCLEEYLEH